MPAASPTACGLTPRWAQFPAGMLAEMRARREHEQVSLTVGQVSLTMVQVGQCQVETVFWEKKLKYLQ